MNVVILDSLLKIKSSDKVKLIKIDVEGMEADVLKGAKGLIEKSRPYLSIEAQENHEEICRLLKEYKYKIKVWEPPYINPDNFAKNDENILGREVVMFNIFCWPEEKELEFDSPYFIEDFSESGKDRHILWQNLIHEYGL